MAINEELETKTEEVIPEEIAPETEQIVPEEELKEEITADETDTAESEDEETVAEESEEPAEDKPEELAETAEAEEAPVKKKKKGFLQLPVIIALCILVGALVGYFVYTGFLMHEPEGLWKLEEEGVTVFFEFDKDGVAKQYLGTMTEIGYCQKTKGYDGDTLSISLDNGFLNGSFGYTVSGSRLLGNQVLTLTYGESDPLEMHQVAKVDEYLTPDKDFVEKEGLTGEWVFDFEEYGVSYKFIFNADGTMILNQYDKFIYEGTYTYTDDSIIFTYYTTEETTTPEIPYEIVDENTLNFMGLECHRAGTSTADEAK